MPIYKTSSDTCIIIVRKAGSMGMEMTLQGAECEKITLQESLLLPNRVVFVKHPLNRLDSFFSMAYQLALDNERFDSILPSGIIEAHGPRMIDILGSNEHHWKGAKAQRLADRVAAKRAEGEISDEDIKAWFDNQEWQRFVDHVLDPDVDTDEHWGDQVELCTRNGNFLPTIAHRFDSRERIEAAGFTWNPADDIQTNWAKYLPNNPLPNDINPSVHVAHNPYRVNHLRTNYDKSIQLWGAIDGTFNPS